MWQRGGGAGADRVNGGILCKRIVNRAMAGAGTGAWWSAEAESQFPHLGRDGEADLWRGLPSSSAALPGFNMLRSRVQTTVGVQPYHQSQQVKITRRGSAECS